MSTGEEKKKSKGTGAAELSSLLSALTGSFKIPDGLFDGLDAVEEEKAEERETQETGGGTLPTELLLKLPEIMSAARPIVDMIGGLSIGGGALGLFGGTDKETSARRRALLTALRPYMSERRRATIDLMISIGKLSEIFEGK